MDCQEVELNIVESFVEPFTTERRLAMEDHLASCGACRSFAQTQHLLDVRLAAAFPPPLLGPAFRIALKKRVRRDPVSAWPDFLPDLAHLIGCALAIVLSAFLLPRHSGTVVLAGAAFTGATYFLQAVIRASLERIE